MASSRDESRAYGGAILTQTQARLERLRKQAANEPGRLAVTDERLHRLLVNAGRGGSY